MIGILDLQGDVVEHLDHLDRLHVPSCRVKESDTLRDLSGLIIPGGESTCLSRLLNIFGLNEAIISAHHRGMKIWGTCAGAILLASEVTGEKTHLALIDMEIERNSFGSQLDSFVSEALIPRIASQPLPLVFIRAPKIKKIGPDVEILFQTENYIAAVENAGILITTFHPEMTGSLAFHRYFAAKCGLAVSPGDMAQNEDWTGTSWTRYARIAR